MIKWYFIWSTGVTRHEIRIFKSFPCFSNENIVQATIEILTRRSLVGGQQMWSKDGSHGSIMQMVVVR